MLDQPHLIHSTDDPPLPPGSQCAGVPVRRSCGSGSIPWPALGLCSSRPKLRTSAGVESVEGSVGYRSSLAYCSRTGEDHSRIDFKIRVRSPRPRTREWAALPEQASPQKSNDVSNSCAMLNVVQPATPKASPISTGFRTNSRAPTRVHQRVDSVSKELRRYDRPTVALGV